MKNRSTLLLVFLAGLFVGLVAARALGRRGHRGPDADRVVTRLTRQLSLDLEQRQKARAIVVEEQTAMTALREKTRAEFEASRQRVMTRLAAILRPDQQERYQRVLERWEERHNKIWKGASSDAGGKS